MADSDSRNRELHGGETMNKQQLVELGATEIGRWPTFETLSPDHFSEGEIAEIKGRYGDIVGFVYDTSSWPVPEEVYHEDNFKKWHLDDPNKPILQYESELK